MTRMTTILAVAATLTLVGCGKQPSGAYDTKYGAGINGANAATAVGVTVTLSRKGDKVTGTYEGGARKGSVDGKLSGHTLRGTWSEAPADNGGGNGSFSWDFTQDWANFSGTFKSRDGTSMILVRTHECALRFRRRRRRRRPRGLVDGKFSSPA